MALNQVIRDYEDKTTNEIAVLTVDSIYPYLEVLDYSADLRSYWGVGKRKKNNGFVVVIVPPQRRLALSTGSGTMRILSDSICDHLIRDYFVKEMRGGGDFYRATRATLDAAIRIWDEKNNE